MRKPIFMTALAAGVAVAGIGLWQVLTPAVVPPKTAAKATGPHVVIPALVGDAVIGARAYEAKCAKCHGTNGVGVEGAGPPFLHKVYEPSHHGDAAFHLAALNGVRAHHWPYGDMPAVDGITKAEVTSIVAYVRSLQAANGIF
ncbi:c-type cytochrome [Pseudorhodobacter ferrugineus]|uniref:c-type cytochrome n=1 Tax=Pseudorhodobacter ferrugineus TaxID=77008 RepID=UPI0003B47E10|nr:cytochrome c [Pseudorhodobacter ferrugineus]